jgi:hypothetical protein
MPNRTLGAGAPGEEPLGDFANRRDELLLEAAGLFGRWRCASRDSLAVELLGHIHPLRLLCDCRCELEQRCPIRELIRQWHQLLEDDYEALDSALATASGDHAPADVGKLRQGLQEAVELLWLERLDGIGRCRVRKGPLRSLRAESTEPPC